MATEENLDEIDIKILKLLQWMRQAICSLQKAVRENPRTLACGENI